MSGKQPGYWEVKDAFGVVRLIEAHTKGSALSHVAKSTFEVTKPDTRRVVELMEAGVKPEKAVADPAPPAQGGQQ